MTNLSELAARTLPKPIARALERLIRRVRVVVLLRGVCAVIATAVGALLLVMAIDASIVLFDAWTRWVLTVSALVLTVASSIWFLILPLARTITMTGIARALEDRHPELQERLSSAVELLTSQDIPELRGSQALIGALAEEAERDALHMRPRSEVSLKAARPYLLAAAGFIAILAALLAFYPNASRLLARAVAPYWNLPNVTGDKLHIIPGDVRLVEGQRLQVDVSVDERAVRRASFRKQMPDGSETAEDMTILAPGENNERRFTLTSAPVSATFRYRIHAGDHLSQYYTVTVVPPPAVKRLEIQYEFPAYTGKKPVTESDSGGEIRAVAGTVVTVSAITNKAVKTADLKINGVTPPQSKVEITATPDGAAVCKFQIRLTPRMRGRWALSLTDVDDIANTTGERLIEAVADKPPVAKILAPEQKKLRLKPSDTLAVIYAVADDFGLKGADFVVETDTRKRQVVSIWQAKTGESPTQATGGEAGLALGKLPLQAAKQFTMRVRATDNLPSDMKGPQEGYSDVITVELDLSAESYAQQVLQAEEEAIKQALEKILKELKKSKEDSVPLKDLLPKTAALNEDLTKRLDRMREHLGVAKGTVGDLTVKVADGPYSGMTPKLNALGVEVDGANDRSGQVKLTEAAGERGSLAAQTDQHIDRAIVLVMELLKDLEKMADAAQLAQALAELAEREAELAAAKAETEKAPEGAQTPADWQKEQAKVAKETSSLVKANPEALKAQLQQDTAMAKDLAAQARELEKEQRALQQDTAQMAKAKELDRNLQNLAAEQRQLANEAAAEPIAKDQAKPMTQAAENIQSGALPQAIEAQKAAENALAQKASPQAQQPPGDKPAGEKPAGQQPSGEKPAGQQPAGEKPSGEKPAGEKPAGEKPAGQQPAGEKPSGEKPSGEKPAGQQPSGEKPAGEQPAGQQPAGQQPAGEKPVTPEQAQKAGQLAQRQADIRQRTEALMAQRNQAMEQAAKSMMARLQAEQAEIAKEAGSLAESAAPAGAEAAQTSQEAAQNANEAAQQIPSNVPEAAKNATEAGQQLAQLAQNLGQKAAQKAAPKPSGEQPAGQQPSGEQPSGEQPSGQQPSGEKPAGEKPAGEQPSGQQPSGQQPSGEQPSGQQPSGEQPSGQQPNAGEMAQMAQQAGELAQRQQQLAKELQALAAGNPQQAAAAEQGALAQQTAELAQEAAALGQRAQAMAPQTPAGQQANQAANQLNQAKGAENQAQQAMSAGQPQNAVPSQETAAQALAAAAQALASLGATLAQAAGQTPAADSPTGTAMAEANSAAGEAAQSPSAASAAEAASAMAEAASAAMAQAQAMGANPGQMPGQGQKPGQQPSQNNDSRKGISAVAISLTAAKLEGMGIKLSDWARLPGELRNQILQAAEEAGPEEYRSLIKRYFQQVAKRGSAETEEKK